jgi:hypothetical protein
MVSEGAVHHPEAGVVIAKMNSVANGMPFGLMKACP